MSMTNEEASNILRLVATEALEGVSRFVESENNRDMFKQAYEMAIKSLEESVSVVRCKDCRHRDPEDHKCDSGEMERQGCQFKVADDYFCAYGERRTDDVQKTD